MTPETTFYQAVVKLCESKGISTTALGKAVGMSESSVNRWKNGAMPQIGTLKKVADFFGVPIDYLKTGEGYVITGAVHNNSGIIGHAHAPVTIINGRERTLTDNETELLKVFCKLSLLDQAKVLVFANELSETAVKK